MENISFSPHTAADLIPKWRTATIAPTGARHGLQDEITLHDGTGSA